MTRYHLVTEIRLAASPERVWSTLEDPTTWPAWWRWLQRVEVLAAGAADGTGACYRFFFRTPLAYSLVFESENVRTTGSARESRVTGELEGAGLWEVAAFDGGCHLRHTWVVATTKHWMNVLAPLARPAFSWNHSVVMREFASGLAGRLDAPLISVTGQAIKPGEPGFGELSPSTAP